MGTLPLPWGSLLGLETILRRILPKSLMNVCECGISPAKAPESCSCPAGEDSSPWAGPSSVGVSKGGQCMDTREFGSCEGSSGMSGGLCPGLVALLGMICGSDCCVVCLDILSLTSASSWGITGADPRGFPVPPALKQDLPQVGLYLHTCPIAGTDLSSEFPQDESLRAAFGLPNPIVDPNC